MRQKISIITKRVLFYIITAGFLLCTVVFFAGFLSFSREFKIHYDSYIRSIGAAARECLNPDSFDKYLETKIPDENYKSVRQILQDFVDKFELNLLYVSTVDGENYQHITYIYNPVMRNSKWTEFPLGYEEEYIEPQYNSSVKRVLENGEVIVRHTLKTRSNSHITAQFPVMNSNGKIVAVIGVQKNIQEFVDTRTSFINLILLIEVIFGVVFIALFSTYFNLKFIAPIIRMTKETNKFASCGGEPSEKLLSIKNRDEIGSLAHSLYQMETDICRNIEQLKKITAEKERIGTELSLSTKIQNAMVLKDYPAFPDRKDFDLIATMESAKEVGGDLYDYILLDDDHLLLVVGDVSGKGVPAALFMMTVLTLLNTVSEQSLSPAEILTRTNTILCKRNRLDLFVTCWLGILTFSTGELKFANAGHPYPILFHNGEYSFVKTKPNLVLAGMDEYTYQENSIKISKGDRIFVYTDGVTEASNSKKELFGDERLLDLIKTTDNLSAPEVIKKIRSGINDFVGDAEQFDDITMLDFIWYGNEK